MKELKFSDDGENFYDFSEIIPEQFIVTDKELDRNLYDQFLDLLRETDMPTDSSVLLRQGGELSDNTMPISQKQLVLAHLARRGTAEAYRLLQHYCSRPDPALEQWSRIALYECRMRLEQDLLEAPVGLISTGLGGDGQRLRYVFVLSFQGDPQEKERHQEMRETLDKVCQRYRSAIEEAQFRPSCLYAQVLVPMDVAVGEVIAESIALLNQRKEELCQDYLVTNVSVPTDEVTQEFLDGLHWK
jgi:hypothetical protein